MRAKIEPEEGTSVMTKIEALESMPDGFAQAELQLIWRGSPQPILEIMALVDVTRGEARALWNARNNEVAEFNRYMKKHGKTVEKAYR